MTLKELENQAQSQYRFHEKDFDLAHYASQIDKLWASIKDSLPPHELFVDLAAATPWILFSKSPSTCEVVNDLYGASFVFFDQLRSLNDSPAHNPYINQYALLCQRLAQSPQYQQNMDLNDRLNLIHERLHQVIFEYLPPHDIIKRYDSPQTLFFLQPKTEFGQLSPEVVAEIYETKKNIKGSWVEPF